MSKIPVTREVQGNAGQVGDVVDSVLDEATMQSIRGPNWVLMDGRNIEGTQLAAITGWTNLPDARGLFRRAKNNGRDDGNENPAGEENIGAFEDDSTKRPNTNFTTNSTGDHRHHIAANINDNTTDDHLGGGNQLKRASNSGDARYVTQGSSTDATTGRTSQVGNHSHSITGGGDDETRPKNITVNTYIKID
jgi:hypothetical protein